MPEELGKIEKPLAEEFKSGKKLYFVPLVFSSPEYPDDFTQIFNRYWEQVDSQIAGLEEKLGPVKHIFHELIPEGGEEGVKVLQQLSIASLPIIQNRIEKGAKLEATENNEILAELMDWTRCLAMELQSQEVYSKVYDSYTEANKKRNEYIFNKITGNLKNDESAILIIAENHHIQFPEDIRLFYIAPPALDELKRWMRDYDAKCKEKLAEKMATEGNPENKPQES